MFPPGRYGRRREARRARPTATVLALVSALVVAFAGAVVLYRKFGDPTYEPQVVSYTEITDDQVLIRFRVRLPAGEGAVCAVRAQSRDGAEVDRAEVPVPPGRTEVTYRLTTTRRAFVGEVPRCRPAG